MKCENPWCISRDGENLECTGSSHKEGDYPKYCKLRKAYLNRVRKVILVLGGVEYSPEEFIIIRETHRRSIPIVGYRVIKTEDDKECSKIFLGLAA